MNIGERMVKRVVALSLVLLISIESFAAVVSDNDGSAFITKAEFDSLKNDFQSQIDQYNTSIDSKIDGAIASYLAGIQMKKTESLVPLISNYQEIWWAPDWTVYGRMRTFTGRTTYTDSSVGWFTPPADKRRNLRSSYLIISDGLLSWGRMDAAFRGDWEFPSDCLFGNGEQGNKYCPVFFLYVLTDDDHPRGWVSGSEPYYLENVPRNYASSIGVGGTADPPYNMDHWWGQQWRPIDHTEDLNFEALDISGEASTVFGKFRTYWYYGNTSNKRSLTFTLDTKNIPILALHEGYNASSYADTQFSAVNEVGHDQPNIATIISNGAHNIQLKFNHYNLVNHMMFGDDVSSLVNVFRRNNSTYSSTGIRVPLYDGAVTSKVNWVIKKYMGAGGLGNWSGDPRIAEGLVNNVTVSLNLPLLPQEKIAEQNSNRFIYDGRYLKFGQGLPMADGLTRDGYLQLKLKYHMTNAKDGGNITADHDLYIDIKNNDYLSPRSDADYRNAYLGIIDPDSASSATGHLLKQYMYPDRTGNVNLTIEAKKGDKLWLRIRPSTKLAGHLAIIDDIDMTYVTE